MIKLIDSLYVDKIVDISVLYSDEITMQFTVVIPKGETIESFITEDKLFKLRQVKGVTVTQLLIEEKP